MIDSRKSLGQGELPGRQSQTQDYTELDDVRYQRAQAASSTLSLLKNALAFGIQREHPQEHQQWDQIVVNILGQLDDQEPLIMALKAYRIEILKPNQNNFEQILQAIEHAQATCNASETLSATTLKERLLIYLTQAKNIINRAQRPAPPTDNEDAKNKVPNTQLSPYALPAYECLQIIDAASNNLTIEQQVAEALTQQFPAHKAQWVAQLKSYLRKITSPSKSARAITTLETFALSTNDQTTTLRNLKQRVEELGLGGSLTKATITNAIISMQRALDEAASTNSSKQAISALAVHNNFLKQKNALIAATTNAADDANSSPENTRLRAFALGCQADESNLTGTPHEELLTLIQDFNHFSATTEDNYDALLLPLSEAWFKAKYPPERTSFFQENMHFMHFITSRGALRPPQKKPLSLKPGESIRLIEQLYKFSLQHKDFHKAFHTLGDALLARIEGNNSSYLFTCMLMAVYYHLPIPGRENANINDSPGMQQLTDKSSVATADATTQARQATLPEDPMQRTLTDCIDTLKQLCAFGTNNAKTSSTPYSDEASIATTCASTEAPEKAILTALIEFINDATKIDAVPIQTTYITTVNVRAEDQETLNTPRRLIRHINASHSYSPPDEKQVNDIKHISPVISLLASVNLDPNTKATKLRLLRGLLTKLATTTRHNSELAAKTSSRSNATDESEIIQSQDATKKVYTPTEIIDIHINAILNIYDSNQTQPEKNIAIIGQLGRYSQAILDYCQQTSAHQQTIKTVGTSIIQLSIALLSDDAMRKQFPKTQFCKLFSNIMKKLRETCSFATSSITHTTSAASHASTPSPMNSSPYAQYADISPSNSYYLPRQGASPCSPQGNTKTGIEENGNKKQLPSQSPSRHSLSKYKEITEAAQSQPAPLTDLHNFCQWFDATLSVWVDAIEINQASIGLQSHTSWHPGSGIYSLTYLCHLYQLLDKYGATCDAKEAVKKHIEDIVKSTTTISMCGQTAAFFLNLHRQSTTTAKHSEAKKLLEIFSYADSYGMEKIKEGRILERRIVVGPHGCAAIFSGNTRGAISSLEKNIARLCAIKDSNGEAPMLTIVHYNSKNPGAPIVVATPQSKHRSAARADQKQIHAVCQLYDREKESGISNSLWDDYLTSALPILICNAQDDTQANIRNFVTLSKVIANKGEVDHHQLDTPLYIKDIELQLIIHVLRQLQPHNINSTEISRDTYKTLCILIKHKICRQTCLDLITPDATCNSSKQAFFTQIAERITVALNNNDQNPMLDGLIALQQTSPKPATYQQIFGLSLIANICKENQKKAQLTTNEAAEMEGLSTKETQLTDKEQKKVAELTAKQASLSQEKTQMTELAEKCYRRIVGQDGLTNYETAAQSIQRQLASDFNNFTHPVTQEYAATLAHNKKSSPEPKEWLAFIDKIATLIEHYPDSVWRHTRGLFKAQGIDTPATAAEFINHYTNNIKSNPELKTQLISIAWVSIIINRLTDINDIGTFDMLATSNPSARINLNKLDSISTWLITKAHCEKSTIDYSNRKSVVYQELKDIYTNEGLPHTTMRDTLCSKLQSTYPPKVKEAHSDMLYASQSHASLANFSARFYRPWGVGSLNSVNSYVSFSSK